MGSILLGLALFAVVVWAVKRRKRVTARDDMTSALGAAVPRPWAGPRRFNGAPSVRMPDKAMKAVRRDAAASGRGPKAMKGVRRCGDE